MYRVRPITIGDIHKENSLEISAVITKEEGESSRLNNDPDVVSKAPYSGYFRDNEELVDTALYSRPTHIKLSIPIVNVFLAGAKVGVMEKVISSKYSAYNLSRGFSILDVSDVDNPIEINPNDETKMSVTYDSSKHLVGGDAIQFLLERTDAEERIKSLLIAMCNKTVNEKVMENLPGKTTGEIVKGNGDVWIIEDYYLNVSDLSILERMNNNAERVRTLLLIGDDAKGDFIPAITTLLEFRDDKSKFINMIQDIIPILPLGYRPTIDRNKDPLSMLYNRVIQANIDLKNDRLTAGCKLGTIRLKFLELYHKYMNLVYKKNVYDDSQYESLIDILTGKTGVIKKYVHASIIDQSGRSVITVDPTLSVDTIGIPEDMALQLCELEAISEFKYSNKNKSKVLSNRFKEALIKRAKAILEGSYIISGRQPTLYRLGVQSFKVKVVEGYSIRLNPISTPAFNADFDGDQMYVVMPQSKMAQEETRRLISNINNIFLPRDGSCHLAPRQEMIYGLYLCYKAEADVSSRTVTYKDNNEFVSQVIEDLNMQDIVIDDKCIVGGVEYRSVGYAALKLFLGGDGLQNTRLGVVPITRDSNKEEKMVTESFFKEYFSYIKLNHTKDTFINIVDRFVYLGFTVANLYAPDINVLQQVDTSDLKEEFDKAIGSREEYYNLGFDTEESFSLFHASEYNKLKDKVMKRVKSELGEDNGFIQLIESGARGSESNLLQLFGMKGTPMKNQAESFNTVITTPLSEQLSGLVHFITAYGSREGVIDKVIGTYAPGYLSRKMTHVARHLSIVSEDCGTEKGIHITYDFLKQMYGVSNLTGTESVDYHTIKDYCVSILETRFIVGGGVTPLTKEEANEVFINMVATFADDGSIVDYGGVKLRSPLTCEDQCCVKCYGTDLTTNKTVIKGTPVGLLTGPTIGEPVTQLIMKNFQRGGVAGVKNLTSSFDTLSDLLEMHPVSKRKEGASVPIIHDYISPIEGEVRTTSRGDGTARLSIMVDGKNRLKSTIYVYEAIELKDYVKVGESIQKEEGILDVNEILRVRGVDEAQMFMLFSAYNIFKNEVFVNFKYFEVLLNGMTLYLCTKGNEHFKVGSYYSIIEHNSHDTTGTKFTRVLRGLKQIPKVRNDFLTSIYLEDVGRTVTRNIIVSGEDELKDPIVRVSLGLDLQIGSDVPGYLKMRGV